MIDSTSLSVRPEKRLLPSSGWTGDDEAAKAVRFNLARVTNDPRFYADGPGQAIRKSIFGECETRTYMISAKVEDGFIQFYFKERPSKPNFEGDGPLDVRIPNHCKIRFILDPDLRWSFRHNFYDPWYSCTCCYPPEACTCARDKCNDAVTLAPDADSCLYQDLEHISDREVVFCAYKRGEDMRGAESAQAASENGGRRGRKPKQHRPWDRDSFNIYVEMEQMAAEMIPGTKIRYEKRLPIVIDPDIQNPGDGTQHSMATWVKALEDQTFEAAKVVSEKLLDDKELEGKITDLLEKAVEKLIKDHMPKKDAT